jgi:hypothetical protein
MGHVDILTTCHLQVRPKLLAGAYIFSAVRFAYQRLDLGNLNAGSTSSPHPSFLQLHTSAVKARLTQLRGHCRGPFIHSRTCYRCSSVRRVSQYLERLSSQIRASTTSLFFDTSLVDASAVSTLAVLNPDFYQCTKLPLRTPFRRTLFWYSSNNRPVCICISNLCHQKLL